MPQNTEFAFTIIFPFKKFLMSHFLITVDSHGEGRVDKVKKKKILPEIDFGQPAKLRICLDSTRKTSSIVKPCYFLKVLT